MSDVSTATLLGLLVILIFISAFFSSSETAMMSLNRYRLKHLRKRHRGARRAAKLLDRPDRLIGLILVGNNAVNILATLIAGTVFIRWFGEAAGVWLTTGLLTIIMLVFAEVTPKTIAAVHPERIAFPAARVLKVLMALFGFLVVSINRITNRIVMLFGIDPTKLDEENMSSEELRTLLNEAGSLIPDQHQDMLLGILDLEKMKVNDIMIPRSDIVGLDLTQPADELTALIMKSEFTRLPVYEGDINNLVGVLHMRSVNRILRNGDVQLTAEAIKRFSIEPYFIPENTRLSIQLMNFRKVRRRFGFVVDEYGDIEGLVTIDDLLEEIVGDYTTSQADDSLQIKPIGHQEFLVNGSTVIRDFNKETGWALPIDGSRTLNGLALARLEAIPEGPVSFSIGDYLFEAIDLGDKVIDKLRIKHTRKSKLSKS